MFKEPINAKISASIMRQGLNNNSNNNKWFRFVSYSMVRDMTDDLPRINLAYDGCMESTYVL